VIFGDGVSQTFFPLLEPSTQALQHNFIYEFAQDQGQKGGSGSKDQFLSLVASKAHLAALGW
jgi:hypothetical protein